MSLCKYFMCPYHGSFKGDRLCDECKRSEVELKMFDKLLSKVEKRELHNCCK